MKNSKFATIKAVFSGITSLKPTQIVALALFWPVIILLLPLMHAYKKGVEGIAAAKADPNDTPEDTARKRKEAEELAAKIMSFTYHNMPDPNPEPNKESDTVQWTDYRPGPEDILRERMSNWKDVSTWELHDRDGSVYYGHN